MGSGDFVNAASVSLNPPPASIVITSGVMAVLPPDGVPLPPLDAGAGAGSFSTGVVGATGFTVIVGATGFGVNVVGVTVGHGDGAGATGAGFGGVTVGHGDVLTVVGVRCDR